MFRNDISYLSHVLGDVRTCWVLLWPWCWFVLPAFEVLLRQEEENGK